MPSDVSAAYLASSALNQPGAVNSYLERLRRAVMPPPPLSALPLAPEQAKGGDFQLNPNFKPVRVGPLMPAAVLVPVVDYPQGERVILTRRNAHLSNHAGQVSFPGGRVDPTDADITAAALREAEEEIGLLRRHVDVLGALDPYVTGTGFAVVPVVARIEPGFQLRLAQQEVEEAFEVPFDFLMDARNHQQHRGIFNGVERQWWAMPYQGHYIWGATAGMLRNLYQRIAALQENKPEEGGS